MATALEIIDKKYRVVKHLGTGGFSDVYLVQGPQDICALKLLKGKIVSTKSDVIEKFKHEFEILKDMRHPHIAAILDFGFDAEKGCYYYTSEFIDGPDLFKATVDMQPEETTDLIVQALRALEYLHSYHIHHFDIKAANILVLPGDNFTVKIIDFGLAGIDPRGRQIGTPSYMPPEIIGREPADGRADLYSLGVLWLTVLTRTNPFRSGNTQQTLERHLHMIPPTPSKLEPAIPKWMDAIVLRLLEKNPSNRFQSAGAVIREINRIGPKRYAMETRETLLSYLPDEGRFIGREHECRAIEDAVSNISKIGGLAQCWFISGGAGSGKSRFLKEIKYNLQLKEIHVRFASAGDDKIFSEWCDKLGSHLASGKGMEVFLLDDTQKLSCDESKAARIRSLIAHAKRPYATASALIALAARETDQDDFFSSLAGAFHGRISIGQFTNKELKEYLTSLTGLRNPPDNLSDGILRRTEGNPLFVTEVIRSLIARGGLFDEHGRWKEGLFEDVGVDFSKVIVPQTIGDLLIERTDLLSKDEKKILEFLAVAKRPASSVELGIWAEIESPRIPVLELIRVGILEKIEAFETQFQNALMGEIIYERIDLKRRRQMHDRIAGSLRAAFAPEYHILEHISLGTDSHAAIHASISLGDNALKSGLGKIAAGYFDRALALIAPDDAEHMIEVQMKLGEAHLIGHNYTAAKNQFTAVEESMRQSGNATEAAKWRIDTLMRLGGTFVKLQDFDRARESLGEARNAISAAGGDRRREIVIENFLAGILFQEGKLNEAREIFRRTRNESLNLSADDRARVTNNDLGALLLIMKDTDGAEKIFDEDLNVAKVQGDDLLIGRAYYNTAQLSTAKKNFPLAIESYEHAAEVCRHSNNIELLLRTYNGMGNTYQLAGKPDLSIKNYERGLELHERIGDLSGGAAIAVNMGIVETSRRNFEAALDRIVPAVEYLKGLPQKTAADFAVLARGLLELGDILCKKGKYEDAMVDLSEAEKISSTVHQAFSMRFWIIATKAEVAAARKDSEKLAEFIALLKPLASDDAERNAIAKLEENLTEDKKMTEEKPDTQHEKLLMINKIIADKSDLSYILKTVLHRTIDLSGARAAAILMFDNEGEISVAARAKNEGGVQGGLMEAELRAEKYKSMVGERTTEPAPDRKIPSAETKNMLDEFNEYDAGKSWKDYERLIIAKCYEANGMNAKLAAEELSISLTTMYKRISEWNLDDTASETYKDTFKYTRGRTLDEYIPLIFRAALAASPNKPTLAIANLKISQGYFYKVMKRTRQ